MGERGKERKRECVVVTVCVLFGTCDCSLYMCVCLCLKVGLCRSMCLCVWRGGDVNGKKCLP